MSGAEEKFAALHTSCGDALLSYFRRRVTVQADAADLVAETYLILWRRIGAVPDGTENARAWAFGVARGVLANYSRGVRRRLALADRLRSELETRPPQIVAVDGQVAQHLLAGLDPLDRELLTLTHWDGLTLNEAAAALGLTASTARVRMHRARKRLRELHRSQPAVLSTLTE